MSETDLILSYLKNKTPAEKERILRSLARLAADEAADAEAERQQTQAVLSTWSLSALEDELERSKPGARKNELLQAHKTKLLQAQQERAAARVILPGQSQEDIQIDLAGLERRMGEAQEKRDWNEYRRLSNEHAFALKKALAAPQRNPAPKVEGDDGEGE